MKTKFEETNAGLLSTHSNNEDISIDVEEEMETRFNEANTGILSKRNNEEISIDVEEEMALIEYQQGGKNSMMVVRSVSGSGDNNSTCPTTDETGEVDNKLVKELNGKLDKWGSVSGSGDNNSTCPTTNDAIVEIHKLVKKLNDQVDKVHPSPSSEFWIYRVSHKIRKLKEEAYQPLLVSIGPFHHGDVRYKSMEAFKMRSLKKVVQRNTRVRLEKYVELLKERETSVRQCYSEIIEMDSDEFVTMLLLDGCFIIELLLCSNGFAGWQEVDYSILAQTRLMDDIMRDFILLENQIPFFVLNGLFGLAMPNLRTNLLLDLAISFFADYYVQGKSPGHISSIKHFTDLLLILQRPKSPLEKFEKFQRTKTATALDEAGVTFKMGNSSKCLHDIKFSNGVLEIPRITLDDTTDSMIRNLMALEVCHYTDKSYVIDYFFFMDDLVNTPKDVDLLVQCEIIENLLGRKQAVDLINNMNTHITITDYYYFSSICKKLNAYCKIPRHRWRAALKRDYFSTPMKGASTCAAIVLLLLTLIQTVLSILRAFRGN